MGGSPPPLPVPLSVPLSMCTSTFALCRKVGYYVPMLGMISRIGAAELVIIFAVVLLIVGPAKLPGMARSAAQSLGKAKKVQKDIQDELDSLNPLKDIKADIDAMNPVKVVKSQLENPPAPGPKSG